MNNNRDPYANQPQGGNPNVNPVFGLTPNEPASGGQQGSSPYETVTPDAVWDSVPNRKRLPAKGPGHKFGIAGVICALMSIILSAMALIFTWLFLVGFIMNILSALLAVAGIIFASVGASVNTRRGLSMGGACIGALVLSIPALILSGILFSCTGCAASFYCSGNTSRLLW